MEVYKPIEPPSKLLGTNNRELDLVFMELGLLLWMERDQELSVAYLHLELRDTREQDTAAVPFRAAHNHSFLCVFFFLIMGIKRSDAMRGRQKS